MAVLGYLEEVAPADSEQVVDDGDGGNGDSEVDGDYVGDLMQLLQIMVEKGLANALERRCGGGDHCCRFQNISSVCSVFCGLSLFVCLFVSYSFRSDCLLFFVLPV